jgi:hypothetical protein
MSVSDRTQFKQVVAGSVGDLRTLSNVNPLASNGCVAQDAQRYGSLDFTTAVAVNVSANYCVATFDRPVRLLAVKFMPASAVTTNGNTVFNIGYTNGGGGALTVLASVNTNVNANLGTGNYVALTPITIPLLAAANQLIPSGSLLVLEQIGTAPSEAVPAGSGFQFIWEEV